MLLRADGKAQFGTGERNGFLVKGLTPAHIAILKWLFEKQAWYECNLQFRHAKPPALIPTPRISACHKMPLKKCLSIILILSQFRVSKPNSAADFAILE